MCWSAVDLHHFDSGDLLAATVGANLSSPCLRLEQSRFRPMSTVTLPVTLIR